MNSPASLVDELMAQLQGAPLQQMAQQLGTSPAQAQDAVGAALPLLLGALGRNAAQPQGAMDLFGALQRDHGGGADLGGLLGSLLGGGAGGGGGPQDGAAILGHKVGDDALVHLAKVVRQHLRPQDVLARYGGEEFVILLPETGDTDAQQALIRLQRELTREFFMADLQKVVITFSAGVTRLAEGESLESALKRADGAMYQAKQAGRNRVMVAPLPG